MPKIPSPTSKSNPKILQLRFDDFFAFSCRPRQFYRRAFSALTSARFSRAKGRGSPQKIPPRHFLEFFKEFSTIFQLLDSKIRLIIERFKFWSF